MGFRIKIWLYNKVKEIVDNTMHERKVDCNYKDDSYKMHDGSRYIRVQTAFPNFNTINYEYTCENWKGYWALHIKPNKQDGYNYVRIVHYLQNFSISDNNIKWKTKDNDYFAIYKEEINSVDQLRNGLKYLYDKFESALEDCGNRFKAIDLTLPYREQSALNTIELEDEVCLKKMSLKDLFNIKLTIPDYQRIYCWNDDNIKTLWSNLKEMPIGLDYHLGAIILHCQEDRCDIIDGQQRLVTLTIMLRSLGYNGNMPLMRQRFKSIEACDNIANAKYVIQEIKGWDREENDLMLNNVLSHLTFSVLLLKSSNIDLAYTFFSNQNSRGVRLSDFDILKAHHLRFLITNESQAEHLARRWNAISQERDIDNELYLQKTLGLHLFRIRKWMRKHSCDISNSSRPIKDEFAAAPLIPGIPPFGEKFYFYEKIQGGAHFFAYTDFFVDLYKQFVKTPQVQMLRMFLLGESNWKYESAIESVLYAYFTKFGKQYLSEALFCIASAVAQHRYEAARALQYKINEYVQNSELVMMIDQASSPSFFLAEALNLLVKSGRDLEGGDIKVRFYKALCNVFKGLHDPEIILGEENLRLAKFTDTFIENKKNAEYE